MRVVLSQHAKERIVERNIEEKDVIYALFAPDKYEPTYGDRMRVQKRIGKRTLEVIYSEGKNIMTVITCYYL